MLKGSDIKGQLRVAHGGMDSHKLLHDLSKRISKLECRMKEFKHELGKLPLDGESKHEGEFKRQIGGARSHQSGVAMSMKIRVPTFDGSGSPKGFVEWLQVVDQVLDVLNLEGREEVELVASKLRGYVSLWWSCVERLREVNGKEEVRTWGKMKRLMKERFMLFPPSVIKSTNPIPSTYSNSLNTTKSITTNTAPKVICLPQTKGLNTQDRNVNTLKYSHPEGIEPITSNNLFKHTLMTIEGDTLKMGEEEGYEESEAKKGKLVGGDDVLEPEEERTKGERKISSSLECPSFLMEEGKHVEKEESLEVTFNVGTKLRGPQIESFDSKEE